MLFMLVFGFFNMNSSYKNVHVCGRCILIQWPHCNTTLCPFPWVDWWHWWGAVIPRVCCAPSVVHPGCRACDVDDVVRADSTAAETRTHNITVAWWRAQRPPRLSLWTPSTALFAGYSSVCIAGHRSHLHKYTLKISVVLHKCLYSIYLYE